MRHAQSTRRSRIALLLAAPAVLLLLAGCAAGGSSPEAPAAPADPAAAAAADEAYSKEWDAFNLKVAQCLRDKGFDVKDPGPGEGFDDSIDGIRQAGTDCYRELGGPPVSPLPPLNDEEAMQLMLKQVECLREKGYQVEDPALDTGFRVPDNVSAADLDTCFAR